MTKRKSSKKAVNPPANTRAGQPKANTKSRENAAVNTSSSAGKRSGQQSKAAGKDASSKPAQDNSELFKFRRYKKLEGGKKKKAKHPKLIVEQDKSTVGFMGLTESEKRGHHKNIELEDNPKTGETGKAYIRKEVRYADLGEFGEILKNYNLSERDKKKIIEYLKKLKKK